MPVPNRRQWLKSFLGLFGASFVADKLPAKAAETVSLAKKPKTASYAYMTTPYDGFGQRSTTVYDAHGRARMTIDPPCNRVTTVYVAVIPGKAE